MNNEPKYHIGQEVWVIYCDIFMIREIVGIYNPEQSGSFVYAFESNPSIVSYWVAEHKIFPTKEELINSL